MCLIPLNFSRIRFIFSRFVVLSIVSHTLFDPFADLFRCLFLSVFFRPSMRAFIFPSSRPLLAVVSSSSHSKWCKCCHFQFESCLCLCISAISAVFCQSKCNPAVCVPPAELKVACLSSLFLNALSSAPFPWIIKHCFNRSPRFFESSSVHCPTVLHTDPSSKT